MVEREQPLVGEGGEELDHEERVACGLLVHQLRQRDGTRRLAAKRIRDELSDVLTGEGRQPDLLYGGARVPDRLELSRQRMCGRDLVVPVSADQHEVLQLRPGQQVLEQIERRGVEPLQVVEEERQRVLRPREDAEESPEHELETPLRVLRREFGRRRLLTDDELELRDQVQHQPPVRLQRLAERVAPAGQLRLALAQKRLDQPLEGLGERGVRDVALVLVELPRGEEAARRHERLLQLVDDRGLADAGVTGDEHQLRPPARHDPVEGGEQRLDVARAPVELLGNEEPVGRVLFADSEVVDPALRPPCGEAAQQVMLDSSGDLVALLGRLREQLHHDRRDDVRDLFPPLVRRHRLPRDVAVHPFHRVGR
ncbi:MAG TPA: hypothetical protein VEM76_19425, partial [Anaeromyxobacteraceae bacterium]|nr:hypothetical protein [Anaeromyxobacteraceae bacterium]